MSGALSLRMPLATALMTAVLMIASVVLPGCNRTGSRLVEVEGRVTCESVPLPVGTVIFSPVDSQARGEARGTIDEHGRFRMVHDFHRRMTGIPAGRYRVSVLAFHTVGRDPETQRHEILVPGRYMNPQTSGIVVEVPEGREVLTIDLDLQQDDAAPR